MKLLLRSGNQSVSGGGDYYTNHCHSRWDPPGTCTNSHTYICVGVWWASSHEWDKKEMWDSLRILNEMWESWNKLLKEGEAIIWADGRNGRELLWELLSSINKWLTGSRGMRGHGWSQAHSVFITHSLVWQFSPGNLSLSQAREYFQNRTRNYFRPEMRLCMCLQ